MDIRLIVGLGNPDPEYASTYHNVGHRFVSFLIGSQELCSAGSAARICTIKLLTTDAYMNESGACVLEAVRKYGCPLDGLLVVHDDSDIAIGSWKFSFARNAGGHRGVQNVIDHLGTNAFWRLRIGIRPRPAEGAENAPRRKWVKAEKFVLKAISASDRKAIEAVFKKVAEEL